jgi:hypothetical protein
MQRNGSFFSAHRPAAWLSYWTGPRGSSSDSFFRGRWELGDTLVLALYTLLLAFGIHHHIPWADEAQAWLLARDCSLHALLLRRLHYEGAPGLWPVILWIAARLHLPYAAINWIGGGFAISGVVLLLRLSPFPRSIRWLLPFTFFLQYQYAVIARPYVLFPALLFLLCRIYTLERQRPILFALVAGLTANISVHAAIIASFFALLYVAQTLKHGHPSLRRPLAAGAALFVVLSCVAAAVAFPAPDVGLAGTPDQTMLRPAPLLLKLMPPERLPASAPPLDPPLGFQPGSVDPSLRYSPFVRTAVVTTILSANATCFPVARSNLLAVAFLAAALLWLGSRRCLRLAIPFFAAVLISIRIAVWDHHTGLFLLALVAALWIALDRPAPPVSTPATPVLFTLSLAVLVLQIGWSAHCLRAETFAQDDPGRETAEFLATHYPGKRIAGFAFESVSAQPYSSRNLFFNQPHAYWVWSVPVSVDRRRTEALLQHPDVVVTGDFIIGNDFLYNQWRPIVPIGRHIYPHLTEFWQDHGYHVTHRFCGDRFVRLGVSHTFCELILEPDSPA